MNEEIASRGSWQRSASITSLLILLILGLYYETISSMVSVWWRSETFAHGFFIFPISLYLIWEKRKDISKVSPEADYKPVFLLPIVGFGWLVAHIVDVQVVQQLGLVAMIPLVVWATLGWPVTKRILFPLGFLFFAVPIGEFLVPPMMNFTADFTVKMIELTGIPVFREGTFFSIPSGDWSVVEGCSGLRYLIASITLGTLFAYMTYRSLARRIAFVVLAIIFPVIANGLRAYMIVMIAHYSDMKLALGVDHYIYGWVFFGIVMFLMFWIGSLWREDGNEESEESEESEMAGTYNVVSKSKLNITAVLIFVACAVWPISASLMGKDQITEVRTASILTPAAQNGWQQSSERITDWEPAYVGQQVSSDIDYEQGGKKVGLYLRYYRNQQQGSELINSQNVLVHQKHPVWKMLDQYPIKIKVAQQPFTVKRSRLSSADKKLLVWQWNWVSGSHTANDYIAKLFEAKDKLLGTPSDAAGIILIAEYDESPEKAEHILQEFMDDMFPSIEKSLKGAAES